MKMKLYIQYPRSAPTFLVHNSLKDADAHITRILREFSDCYIYRSVPEDAEETVLYTVKLAGRTLLTLTLKPVRTDLPTRGVDLPTPEQDALPMRPSEWDRFGGPG